MIGACLVKGYKRYWSGVRYTKVLESLVWPFTFMPVVIHRTVVTSVIPQRLNSVQPNASTVCDWRHLRKLHEKLISRHV